MRGGGRKRGRGSGGGCGGDWWVVGGVSGGGLLNLYSSRAWNTCRVFELGMLFSLNIDMGHRQQDVLI